MSPLQYRLLLIGAPGVGKGTYSKRAAKALNLSAISSGELLRQIASKDSPLARQVQEKINAGVYVPDSLVNDVVLDYMKTRYYSNKQLNGYMLDGFPRNASQARYLWDSKALPIDHVINLTQPTSVILAKLSGRRMCAHCGFVYNLNKIDVDGARMDQLLPKVTGVCDSCGSKDELVRRADDDENVVKKRLAEYDELSKPLLDFYASKDVLHEFPVLGDVKEYFPKFIDFLDHLYK